MSEKPPIEFVFTPAFVRDPYAVHAAVRDKGPVHAIDVPPGTDAFLVIGYQHGRLAPERLDRPWAAGAAGQLLTPTRKASRSTVREALTAFVNQAWTLGLSLRPSAQSRARPPP